MPIVAGPGDPGGTVTSGRLWLNSCDDPSDVMSFRLASYTPAVTKPGDVRELAGGRLRLVTRAGKVRSLPVVVRIDNDAQAEWLDDHLGELVTARDPSGGKFAGTYLTLEVPHAVGSENSVSLSFSQVTVPEAV